MCFADKNNIYLHDGQNPKPIADRILRGASGSWQSSDRDYSFAPKVMFDGVRNSFVIFLKTSSTYYAWAYNVPRNRWDYWAFGGNNPKGILTGKNGEMFISDGTNLVHYLGHTTENDLWAWTSKKLTMGQDTQIKKFKKWRITGSPSGTIGTNVYVKLDGNNITESGTTSEFTGDSSDAKFAQIFLAAQDGAASVDAIGTIFRRKPVK